MSGLTFADADADYSEADAVILGVPYDRTACFRAGSRDAPFTVRRSSYNFEVTHFEHGVYQTRLHDLGNTEDFFLPEDMMEDVRFHLSPSVNDKKFTVVIGGEHSVTLPAVECHGDVSVISIDAHLDSRDEFMGTRYSHACVMRRCADLLGTENVFVLGVRSVSEEEREADDPIGYIDSYTIMEKGMEWAVRKALDSVRNDKVYLTLDIDGIDPAFAPGTGTPEPFGLTPMDVKKAIGLIGDRMVGFDVNEICPPYDPSGITSVLGARFVKETLAVFSGSLRS
jgi:agmatinase